MFRDGYVACVHVCVCVPSINVLDTIADAADQTVRDNSSAKADESVRISNGNKELRTHPRVDITSEFRWVHFNTSVFRWDLSPVQLISLASVSPGGCCICCNKHNQDNHSSTHTYTPWQHLQSGSRAKQDMVYPDSYSLLSNPMRVTLFVYPV